MEAPSQPAVVLARVDPAALPADLQALFAEAKKQDKPVLVEFSGPG